MFKLLFISMLERLVDFNFTKYGNNFTKYGNCFILQLPYRFDSSNTC